MLPMLPWLPMLSMVTYVIMVTYTDTTTQDKPDEAVVYTAEAGVVMRR